MKIIFDDGKEIEFDENEVALQDPRERIFKKDGIWYITKIINKDFAEWLDETPIISKLYINNELQYNLEEKKIPEKLDIKIQNETTGNAYITNEKGTKCYLTKHSKIIAERLNQVIDYLKSKGDE